MTKSLATWDKSRPGTRVEKEEDVAPLEIISTQTTRDQILQLFKKHEYLAAFQICGRLKIHVSAAGSALRKMEDEGLLESSRIKVKLDAGKRQIRAYKLKSRH